MFPSTRVDPPRRRPCAPTCKNFVRAAHGADFRVSRESGDYRDGVTAASELDKLYRVHAAEVFRYAYAVLGNRADAEDVTQTTFVNALRALDGARSRGSRPTG